MTFLVVPDSLHDAIHKKLDDAFKLHADAEKDRDSFYSWLVNFFDEHGYVPDFTLEPKP